MFAFFVGISAAFIAGLVVEDTFYPFMRVKDKVVSLYFRVKDRIEDKF